MLGATNDAKSIPNPSILDYVAVALSAGCALLSGSLCIAAAAAAMPEGAARWIAPIPLRAHGCALSGTQVS